MKILRIIHVLIVKRMSIKSLKALILNTVRLILKHNSPKESMKFIMDLDYELYKFHGESSVRYGDGVHSKHRHMKYHDFFIENIMKGEAVIDIGCGNGVLANAIARNTDCKSIWAIDIVEDNIKKAKERFSHGKIEYVVGDATKDLKDEIFDAVVLSNVLEHLKERGSFLQKVKTQVNPDRFLIRVPLFERDWRVPLKKELGIEWRLDETHETEYTLESFSEELAEADLVIESKIVKWGEIWAVCK